MSRSRSRVAALLLLSGCAANPSPIEQANAAPATEYRGVYTRDTAGSWFRPCGMAAADSAWWVTLVGPAVSQMATARRDGRLAEGRPAYVRWLGATTTSGAIGPRGPGVPALLVRALVEARPEVPAECAAGAGRPDAAHRP